MCTVLQEEHLKLLWFMTRDLRTMQSRSSIFERTRLLTLNLSRSTEIDIWTISNWTISKYTFESLFFLRRKVLCVFRHRCKRCEQLSCGVCGQERTLLSNGLGQLVLFTFWAPYCWCIVQARPARAWAISGAFHEA